MVSRGGRVHHQECHFYIFVFLGVFSYIFDFRSLNSWILLKTTLVQQTLSKYICLRNFEPNPPNARTVQTIIF